MFYKTLFNINIHHAYFLNEGTEKFTNMSEANKTIALRRYLTSNYLNITPTTATKSRLKNHRMLFKLHKQGFRILINTNDVEVSGDTKYVPIIPLDDDLTLTFELRAHDIFFDNYTQITSKTNKRLYLFSNTKPDAEAVDFGNIFTEDGTIDTSFLLTEKSSRAIIQSIAEDDSFVGNNTALFSIVNQIDTINNDDTLTANQKENNINAILNAYLLSHKKNGLIGLIKLTVKGDSTHHLLEFDDSNPNDIKQYTLEDYPDFTLSFKNRRTFWRYQKTIDDITLTTQNKKPLTQHGFVEITASDFDPEPTEDYVYPNPTADIIINENNDYYSEIFI